MKKQEQSLVVSVMANYSFCRKCQFNVKQKEKNVCNTKSQALRIFWYVFPGNAYVFGQVDP